jgi:hypothetical protein
MPRNPVEPLTADEARTVALHSADLWIANGTGVSVTVDYRKRDGSTGTASGPVVEVLGTDSTLSVVIDSTASKGRPTTVNVRLIDRITGVWQ